VPRFAFGHGLSYSTFEYAGLQVAASGSHDNNVVCTVNFTLSNTGKADGATVPQLYLGFPATAGEPPMQLKGFENVSCVGCWQSKVVAGALDRASVDTSRVHNACVLFCFVSLFCFLFPGVHQIR